MSYEDIITIIFVAVQVVKKEVIVHRPKTPPQAKLGLGTLDMDCAGVGHPPPGRVLTANTHVSKTWGTVVTWATRLRWATRWTGSRAGGDDGKRQVK